MARSSVRVVSAIGRVIGSSSSECKVAGNKLLSRW
jgi:hypothetical protein